MKKWLKKIIVGFVAAVALMIGSAGILPEGVFDGFTVKASAEIYGWCGDNLTYKLDDEGTLTISGTGGMVDRDVASGSNANIRLWEKYSEKIKNVIIENGVTTIGGNAFYGCRNLQSVTIGDSVWGISSFAFCGCSSLAEITLPDSITYIGRSAFRECSSLQFVNNSANLETIKEDVFFNCKSLKSIYIPEKVRTIGTLAFGGCVSLKEINVSPDNKYYYSVDGVLFQQYRNIDELVRYPAGKQDETYSIPDRVNTIGYGAFEQCENLISIDIPESVTSVDEYVFYKCSGLESIAIPSSITYISQNMFRECTNLVEVILPDTLTLINNDAFADCLSLSNIIIPDSVKDIGGSVFENCTCLTTISIPKEVRVISTRLFYNCINLSKVIFSKEDVHEIKSEAFWGCSSLSEDIISDSDSDYDYIYTIGKKAFYGCTNFKNLDLKQVAYIEDEAFYGCSNLESVIVEATSQIGKRVFSNCSQLIEINIVSINGGASINLSSDNGVLFNGDQTQIICYPAGKSENSYTVPDTVEKIAAGAFEGSSKLTSIIIPESVLEIGDLAFSLCSNLAEISISDNVIKIGPEAFYECKNLIEFSIPNNVTNIYYKTFYGCSSLNKLIIPDSIVQIGKSAFYGCSNLSSIFIPDSVQEIGNSAFENCTKLSEVRLSDNLMDLCDNLFSNCISLKNINIPTKIGSLDSISFYGCINLKSIILPRNVYRINTCCFEGCVNLNDIYYSGSKNDWECIAITDDDNILKNITVHYNYGKEIVSISIDTLPNKLSYRIDEDIDISGGSIKVIYYDETTEIIDMTLSMISGYNSEVVGKQTILISYEGKTTSFEITVRPAKEVTSISVNVPNNAKKPIEGSDLDLTDYTLTVKYDDKSTDTIALTANMVTGYDANKIGKQKLTVVYGGKTAIFEVTVMPDPKNMPVIINGEPCDTLTNALKVWKSGALNITINKSLTEKTLTIPKTVTSATITTAPGAVLTLSTPTITANCDLTLDAVVAAEKANAKTFTVKTIADKTVTVNRLETTLPITLSGTKTSNFVLNTGSTLNLAAAATINVEIAAGTTVKLDGGKFTSTTLSGAGKLDVYGAATITLADARNADITLNKYEKKSGKNITVNLQKLTVGTVGAVTLTVKEPDGTLSNISGQAVITLQKNTIIDNLENKITITNTANGNTLSAVQYSKDVRAEYLDALTVVGLKNFSSFEKAFEAMTDTTANYTVRLNEDTSLAKLTLPKQIGSLTIDGNNKTLTLTGVTSIAPKYGLTLKDINITAVNAKGAAAALAINVTTGNAAIDGLNFNGKTLTIKGGKDNVLTLGECSEIYSMTGFAKVNITDDIAISKTFTANDVKLGASANLTLMNGAALKINKGKAITGDNGATITLVKCFTPIDLTGTLASNIKFVSATTLEDQPIFKTKADLKGVYDLSGIAPDNGLSYDLLTSGQYVYLKAYTIDVNGTKYAFWDDVVKAITSKTTDYTIKLLADVNIGAALKLPAASKCKSLTIDGNGHKLTFTGTSLSVTLPLTLKDITVTALNKKTLAETAWTLKTNNKLTEVGNVVLTQCTKK